MILAVMGILLVCFVSYALAPQTKVKSRAQRFHGVNAVRTVSFTFTNAGSLRDTFPNSGK